MARAQFSIDLLAVIAIMLLLFLALFQFYLSKSQDVGLVSEKLKGMEIADAVSARVNLALTGGNGTRIGYALPGKILERDYGISIAGRRVEVAIRESILESPVLTSNIESFDLNSRKGGVIFFLNVDGKIRIE